MGLFGTALLVAVTAVSVKILPLFWNSQLPLHFGGHVESQYTKVQDAFRENFEKGWEHEGAAFAVYHKGKLVVDLWGGYADESSMRQWQEDTMSTAFSATKAVASVCVAVLVDKGLLSYDNLVTEYWPEFGKNGKDKVTTSMIMNHQVGLVVLDQDVTIEDVKDHKKMSRLFEEQKPNWPLNEMKRGYHALTYGFLIDQIIRRVDPQERSIGQFFNEEIAQPNKIDFYIGLPSELEYRVTRLSSESFVGTIGQMIDDPNFLTIYFSMLKVLTDSNSLFSRLLSNIKWLGVQGRLGFNNPEVHQLEIAAANGIGTARGLAKILSLIASGDLLSEKTIKLIEKPQLVNPKDHVLNLNNFTCGYGFLYTNPPGYSRDYWQFGHPGFGGSNVKVDLKNQLAFAYVTNGLKDGMGDFVRTFAKLQKALYSSL